MNNRKLIVSVLVMLITVSFIILYLIFNVKETEKTFTAYVDINPLIKLDFKVTCDKDNSCSSPLITDFQLINEDAKIIYKDLVLKDKTLSETIELLASTVKYNDIAFKIVHIYTNYDKEEEFKIDNVDYEIALDIKKDEEFKQTIDKLVFDDANKKTKEILVPVTYPKSLHDRKLSPTSLKPLEDEELFVKEYIIIAESDNEKIPSLRMPVTYIKITVLGPSEVINTLPEKYSIHDDSYIYGFIDATGLEKGTYTLPLEFSISRIDNIEVITPSIECQFEIVAEEDMPFPLEPY